MLSRGIVHVSVTTNSTLPWVGPRIREATAWDQTPRFLVHLDVGRVTGPEAPPRPRISPAFILLSQFPLPDY